jgi:hypothetical protein
MYNDASRHVCRLTRLDLSNSLIDKLPEALGRLTALQEIELQDMKGPSQVQHYTFKPV